MNRKFFFYVLISGFLSVTRLCGQTAVTVAESTLKVGLMGEEIIYFGFAEGDKLIFSFEEANGKELKEVELVELPSSSKFMEYKTKKIDKTFIVTKTGIYKFRFTNSAIGVRLCKYKIQRIPATAATQNFDCTVYWRTGYDTTYTTDTEEFLSNSDTIITNFQDRTTKVLPSASAPGNKACFNFVLPDNTVSWSFYLSIDAAGQQLYAEAVKKFAAGSSYLIKKYPNHSPLLALALGHESYLSRTESPPAIDYWVMDGDNGNLFMTAAQFRYMKKGKVNHEYSRMELRKGALNFCFSNNNPSEVVSVTVKIAAVQVNQFIDTRQVKRMSVVPKKEMYLKN